jgi:hypothetical protein
VKKYVANALEPAQGWPVFITCDAFAFSPAFFYEEVRTLQRK